MLKKNSLEFPLYIRAKATAAKAPIKEEPWNESARPAAAPLDFCLLAEEVEAAVEAEFEELPEAVAEAL